MVRGCDFFTVVRSKLKKKRIDYTYNESLIFTWLIKLFSKNTHMIQIKHLLSTKNFNPHLRKFPFFRYMFRNDAMLPVTELWLNSWNLIATPRRRTHSVTSKVDKLSANRCTELMFQSEDSFSNTNTVLKAGSVTDMCVLCRAGIAEWHPRVNFIQLAW